MINNGINAPVSRDHFSILSPEASSVFLKVIQKTLRRVGNFKESATFERQQKADVIFTNAEFYFNSTPE